MTELLETLEGVEVVTVEQLEAEAIAYEVGLLALQEMYEWEEVE